LRQGSETEDGLEACKASSPKKGALREREGERLLVHQSGEWPLRISRSKRGEEREELAWKESDEGGGFFFKYRSQRRGDLSDKGN